MKNCCLISSLKETWWEGSEYLKKKYDAFGPAKVL